MRSLAGILIAVEAVAILFLLWLWLDARSELAGSRVPNFASSAEHADPPSVARDRASRPAAFRTGTDSGLSLDAAASSRASVLRDDAATAWSPDDPLGIVIFGRILDESGNDIEGGVRFESEQWPSRSGDTEKGLGFVARGLRPGAWTVGATAPACVPFESQIELGASPIRLRYDIALRKATITFVKFRTPEGELFLETARKQVPNLHWRVAPIAVATAQRPGPRLRSTESAGHDRHAIGSWEWRNSSNARINVEVPEGCDGFLVTHVAPPFFASAVVRDEILQTKEVTKTNETVTFSIDVGEMRSRLSTVRLRVVDSDKKPIPDVQVELNDRQSGGGGKTSSADGTVVLENYPPGLLVLEIYASAYAHVEQYVRLVPGQVVDLGDIVLDPATSIEGRLLGPDGLPIAGSVSHFFLETITFPQPLDFAGSGVATEADGRFRFAAARRGRYLLIGSDDGHAKRSLIVDTTSGPVRNVDLVLGPGTRVTFDAAAADVDCLMQLRDSAGTLLVSHRVWGSGRWAMTLAQGAYTLTVFDDDRLLRTRPFSVGPAPMHVRVGE